MKQANKLLSIVLTLALTLSMIPIFAVTANAAEFADVSDIDTLRTLLESNENYNLTLQKDLSLSIDDSFYKLDQTSGGWRDNYWCVTARAAIPPTAHGKAPLPAPSRSTICMTITTLSISRQIP